MPDRSRRLAALLTVAGCLLLLLWAGLWTASLTANRLIGGSNTWIPRYHYLGVDFLFNYHAVRVWLDGGNPYEQELVPDGPTDHYNYPPFVLRVFAWCRLAPARVATTLWTVALAALTILGGYFCWRARSSLAMPPLPLPWLLAILVWSTPVIYAMERGNCDLLIVPLLIAVAGCLCRSSSAGDVAAGACLAAAAWLKVYPALAGLAFVALRRPYAVVSAAMTCLLIGLTDIEGVGHFLRNFDAVMARHIPYQQGVIRQTTHTITGCWPLLWQDTPLAALGALPGWAAWAILLLPLAGWVSYRLARLPDPKPFVFGYLLWMAAAATFLPYVSNDYNLIFLLMAALIVWDRRDPIMVQVALLALALWWQPFVLPVEPRVLFFCKLAGVYGVAVCLARRMRQATAVLDVDRPVKEIDYRRAA